jgi:uncharacterized protein (TIGR03435 family)
MVDLIRIGYGFDNDKILGGPSWLEMDRFDLVGKVPAGATLESVNLMLQAALEERFKLAVHKDTKALPTYVLTAGKQHRLKPASGTEEPGCRPPSAPTPAAGDGPRLTLMTTSGGGTPVTYTLGPGMTIQYQCRNVTMAGFAATLRSMFGANVGTNPVLDETGLTGNWNFDIRFSLNLIGPPMGDAAERISLTDAVDGRRRPMPRTSSNCFHPSRRRRSSKWRASGCPTPPRVEGASRLSPAASSRRVCHWDS